jgi:hypothetical protein
MSDNYAAPQQQASTVKIIAYRIPDRHAYPKIVRAAPDRFWMDITTQGWANRCLPLRIANQAGWFILNDEEFEVTWDGSPKLEGISFKFKERESNFARSMFGFGIVTWTIPYVFRTESGFNLLARGPSNMPKDGASALEGIVETDWLPYSFTMNWKITRPMRRVRFEKDEPICMITPIRRGDLERFDPQIVNMTSDASLHKSFSAWHTARLEKVRTTPQTHKTTESLPKVQGNYIRGEGLLEERAVEHQNKLDLRNFTEVEPALISESSAIQEPAKRQNGRVWAWLTKHMK